MMHPDDIRRLAIMATLILLCVLSSGVARPVGGYAKSASSTIR